MAVLVDAIPVERVLLQGVEQLEAKIEGPPASALAQVPRLLLLPLPAPNHLTLPHLIPTIVQRLLFNYKKVNIETVCHNLVLAYP